MGKTLILKRVYVGSVPHEIGRMMRATYEIADEERFKSVVGRLRTCHVGIDESLDGAITELINDGRGRLRGQCADVVTVDELPAGQLEAVPGRVIHSSHWTIVLWGDGTRTVARAAEGDEYDPAMGVLVCCYRKVTRNRRSVDDAEGWLRPLATLGPEGLLALADAVDSAAGHGSFAAIRKRWRYIGGLPHEDSLNLRRTMRAAAHAMALESQREGSCR